VSHAVVDHFWCGSNRILHGLIARWDRSAANRRGQRLLQQHRFGACAETALHHVVHDVGTDAQCGDDKQK